MREMKKMTLDKKFKPFKRSGTNVRDNMAVWSLKGVVNYDKASESTRKYTKKGSGGNKPRRRGGVQGGDQTADQTGGGE